VYLDSIIEIKHVQIWGMIIIIIIIIMEEENRENKRKINHSEFGLIKE
jgi:hypothetical protein